LFFQLERERIIAGIDHLPFTADDVERVAIARRLSDMQPDKPKRKHRKSHGKITFAELARAIANRWRGLDAHSKGLLIERAALEKSRFLRELEEWTKIHGTEEDEAATGKSHPKEVRIVAASTSSSSHEGKPPISQRATKPIPDASMSQSRPPMHPAAVNRTVTPDTRMKCAMEMTAFANMRISNNSPSSQMFKPRPNFNNFQQISSNQSSFGNRLDSNLYHPYNNNLPSLNTAIAARTHQSYANLLDNCNGFSTSNRALSSYGVRATPTNGSAFLHSNIREAYSNNNSGYFQNDLAYDSSLVPQSMICRRNSNSDQSSSNMDQLLANVEYELRCSKVTGERLSKLLATLQRRNHSNTNSNDNNANNCTENDGNQYM
jgi:hypothetical protein